MDLNRDGKVSLGELVVSAFLIVAGVFSFLLIVGLTIWAFVADAWTGVKFLLTLITISGAVSIIVALWRLFRYERGEKRDNAEWALKREKEEWELDQIKGVVNQEAETNWTQATQDEMARRYLFWSYKQGQFVTREEWKKKGQPEVAWNRINGLMKEHKIRSKRSRDLQHDDFAEAWGAWCDAMIKSRSWVRSGEDFIKN